MKLIKALERVSNENCQEEWSADDWKFHVNRIPLPSSSTHEAGPSNIYLGSECAAFHPLWLVQNSITHVLTVMPESQIPTIAPIPLSGVRKIVPLLDVSSTPIQDHFSDVYHWMMQLPIESKVLIHCQAGISRSVTLLASYFIRRYRLSYEDTIKHLIRFRRQCGPNNGFVYQLRRLHVFCKEIDSLPLNATASELILDYL